MTVRGAIVLVAVCCAALAGALLVAVDSSPDDGTARPGVEVTAVPRITTTAATSTTRGSAPAPSAGTASTSAAPLPPAPALTTTTLLVPLPTITTDGASDRLTNGSTPTSQPPSQPRGRPNIDSPATTRNEPSATTTTTAQPATTTTEPATTTTTLETTTTTATTTTNLVIIGEPCPVEGARGRALGNIPCVCAPDNNGRARWTAD